MNKVKVSGPRNSRDSAKTNSFKISDAEPVLPLRLVLGKALKLSREALSFTELLLLFLSLAWSLTGAIGALAQRWFIDAAANLVRNPSQNLLVFVCIPLGIILFLQAGEQIVQALEQGKVRSLWQKVALWCEETLIVKASGMEYSNFANQATINRLTRANNEFADRMRRVLSGGFRCLSGLVGMLSVFIVLLSFAWYIPLILLAGSLPALFFYRAQTKEAYESAVHSTGSTRRVWYFLTMLTTRGAMKEIRFGGIHPYLSARHDECADEVSCIRMQVLKRQALFGILGLIFRYVSVFAVLCITASLILKGQASIGTLALVLSAAATLQGGFSSAANALADIRDSGRYFQDYLELMKLPDEACSNPAKIGVLDLPGNAVIECKELYFTYPGNQDASLKNLNLHIAQGERIAIVGENGSGKSTFVSLLCGLYAPQKGTLSIAGKEASVYRDHTRQVVSAALQEFQRYEMDVAGNIAIGNPYQVPLQEEIEAAARTMGIHDFFCTLPQGYNTHLGQMVEGGRDMSGGEWQKLILARTLMKKQARIMILDEPTASLDPPSEAALYRAYEKITGDRTSILVSHRLGSCKLANRILVFHKGSIVEEGSHQKLMALGGQYYRMFSAQASWYQS